MINRLRRRFVLIAMVSVTLVMGLLGAAINLLNFYSVNDELKHMLYMLANNKGAMPAYQDGKPDREAGADIKKDMPFTPETPFATRYFVLFYDADGKLLRSDMRHIAAVTRDDAGLYLREAIAHDDGYGYYNGYKYFVKTTENGERLAVFLDCRKELDYLEKFALITVAVILTSTGLVFILVFFLSKRAAQNAIKNEEKQKRFITDAGHELKTPLTVITTSLKVLELDTGPNKWIDKIRNQTDKLTSLTQDLVALARLDEEKPALQASDFDISEAVTETAESFTETAREAGLSVEIDTAPNIMYKGDEYAIRRLISILMDNAVKYSDTGGQIRVSLKKEKAGVSLSVSNPCADIGDAELKHVFDRFYRADKSRTGAAGGFGIGLSIAKSTAEAHRGTIKAAYEGGIVTFTVTLL